LGSCRSTIELHPRTMIDPAAAGSIGWMKMVAALGLDAS
jgi:hypothetical protein